jgi:ABC-type transport system involved in multi-copper enzyme maturation permease subunit
MKTLIALLKKEFFDDFLAARGAFLLFVASVVLSAFSLLMISNTELSLLDNAQALYLMTAIILTLASFMAVVRGSDGFAGERDRETLEALLLAPITGPGVAAAKLVGIFLSWLILFALSIPYLWAVGSRGQNLWYAIGYLSITGTLLVVIFGGLALALSAKMKTFKGVLAIGLTLLLFSASPVLLGPSLRQSTVGQMMDFVNPFADALNTLDSVVIDGQGIVFQLLRLSIMTIYSVSFVWLLRTATTTVDL